MCYCFISVLKQNNHACQKMECPYQHISKNKDKQQTALPCKQPERQAPEISPD